MVLRRFMVIGLALAALGLLAACGDDDDASPDERAEIEAAIREVEQAERNRDADAYLAATTDNLINKFGEWFGLTADDIRQNPDDFFGDEPPMTIHSVSTSGDRATATGFIPSENAPSESWVDVHLVRRDGRWLIDDIRPARAERTPDGARNVDVDMDEFVFDFDEGDVRGGSPVVFRGNNRGDQPHIMVVAKIPEDADIEDLLAFEGDGPPPGVEDIADSWVWGPGEEGDVVVTRPLEAGRYIMLCFLPDYENPQNPPHFAQGMLADFMVD